MTAYRERIATRTSAAGRRAEIERGLIAAVAEVLELDASELDPLASPHEFGLESLSAIEVAAVASRSGIAVEAGAFFAHPSVRALAAEIARGAAAVPRAREAAAAAGPAAAPAATSVTPRAATGRDACAAAVPLERGAAPARDGAILGMACRLPRASDPAALWRILADGVCAVGPYPVDGRPGTAPFLASPEAAAELSGAYLSDVDRFDAGFFDLSPAEAAITDPQQRLLLETGWEAFEDAGVAIDVRRPSRTGVFIGATNLDYRDLLGWHGVVASGRAAAGNTLSMLANRVSYTFGFVGPSLTVDTACSSSLVALDLACNALRAGLCDLALVAGVNVILNPAATAVLRAASFLSRDGRCKTFAADADGYGRGEGVVALVLRSLDRARAAGDRIRAVVRATAVNHDGNRKMGLTVPSPDAQRDVYLDAYRACGVDPASITLVEAHGTGTLLGDQIEVKGLAHAFGEFTRRRGYCALGSVKTNVSHGESAAGLTGVLKVVLALERRTIPPSLGYESPSPHIRLDDTPFFVPTRCTPWDARPPRRAAVSSFGFGGVNAHAVLEEAPDPGRGPAHAAPAWHLLPLAARTDEALRALAARYRSALAEPDAPELVDACFTASVGRAPAEVRAAVLARSRASLLQLLDALAGGVVPLGDPAATARGAEPCVVRGAVPRGDEADALPPLQVAAARLAAEPYAALRDVAGAWTRGRAVAWETLFAGLAPRRVALPSYPFAATRFWAIAAPPTAASDAETAEARSRAAPPATDEHAVATAARAVREPATVAASTAHELCARAPAADPRARLAARLVAILGDLPIFSGSVLAADTDFTRLGLESLDFVRAAQHLEEILGAPLDTTALYDHPTPRRLAAALLDELPEEAARLAAEANERDGPLERRGCGPAADGAGDVAQAVRALERRVAALERAQRDGAAAPRAEVAAALPPATRARRRGSDARPVRIAERDAYELSRGQQRLWLLHELAPDSSAYDVIAGVRLTAGQRADDVARVVRMLVRRHESLRTAFVEGRDGPRQRIVPSDEVALEVPLIDLGAQAAAEQPAALDAAIAADVALRFDLERAPPLRAALFRLDPATLHLHLRMPHLVSDGWSVALLVGDLALGLAAIAAGGEPALDPLPLRYVDFAHWQNARLAAGGLERERRYWTRRLAAPHAPLAWPDGVARATGASRPGGSWAWQVSRERMDGVRALARARGVTPSVVELAAFATLLHRVTGADDVRIGMPVAGRVVPEVAPIVGFFVNTVVLRIAVQAADPLATVLDAAARATTGALAHQGYPFDLVVRELAAAGGRRAPLFAAMFVAQNAAGDFGERLAGTGIEVVPGTRWRGAAQCDLTLHVHAEHGAARFALDYDRELFRAGTIRALAAELDRILDALVSDPARACGAPPGAPRLRRPVAGAAPARVPDVVERSFAEAWLCQVRHAPAAVALADERDTLTFAAAEEAATRIAAVLRARGAGCERRVALVAERGARAVAGLLGVLRSGAAYAPLDPLDPPARLRAVLHALDPVAVLAAGEIASRLVGVDRAARRDLVLDLDALLADGARAPGTDAGWAPAHAAQLAYVLATSGSTGAPKGVLVARGALDHLRRALVAAIPAYRAPERLRIAVNAPLFFDASVKQVVLLAEGHTLVVVPAALRADAAALARWLAAERIDVVDVTPALLRALRAAGWPAPLQRAPRAVLVGGEAIDEALWRDLRSVAGVAFWNLYGPTECTVDATACAIGAESALPSLGEPIGDATVVVADRHGRAAACGERGEIVVAGPGVARGYLGDPAATAAAFVPAASGPPGARAYRTGDEARRTADGRLESLGRRDGQVKVRGRRVETGEVEAALRAHPRVHDAAVVAVARGNDVVLAAHWCAHGDDVDERALRAHLAARLPAALLPARFTRHATLPRTRNGKLDRGALRALGERAARESTAGAVPRSPTERLIAELWSELAGGAPVAREDRFFALGGDSLRLPALRARLHERLGRAVPLGLLAEDRPLAELAELLDGARDGATCDATVLLCLPCAGGVAAAFDGWAAALPGVRVVAVEYPGHGARAGERCCTTAAELVARLRAEQAAALERPERVMVFGHSFGGLVAFLLARAVERDAGAPLRGLLVASRRAPHLPGALRAPIDDDALAPATGAADGLAALRADLRIAAEPVPDDVPALTCPITVMRGRADPLVTDAELRAWHVHTAATFARVELAGGHDLIDEAPAALLAVMRAALAGGGRAGAREPDGAGEGTTDGVPA